MDNFNYNMPISGYNPLRMDPSMRYPSMSYLNKFDPGNTSPASNFPRINQNNNPFQTPVDTSNSDYQMKSKWEFGLNYNHIALSNAVQSIGSFFRGKKNNEDFKSYNRAQSNPLLQLPFNPNTSQQSQYGMNQYAYGGYAEGGFKAPVPSVSKDASNKATNFVTFPYGDSNTMQHRMTIDLNSKVKIASTNDRGFVYAYNAKDEQGKETLLNDEQIPREYLKPKMLKGGMKKYPDGGPGPDIPAGAMLTNKQPNPNAHQYDMIDLFNSSIGSGVSPLSTKEGKVFLNSYNGTDKRDLINAASIFNQRDDVRGLSPEQRIDMFYRMPNNNPTVENYRQRTKNLSGSILDFNRTSPNVTNQEQLLASKGQGGPTADKAKEMLRDGTANGQALTAKQKGYFGWIAGGKKAMGGPSDDFNQEDMDELRDMKEDLQDYLDKIHSQPANAPVAEKEEESKPDEETKETAPDEDDEQPYKSDAMKLLMSGVNPGEDEEEEDTSGEVQKPGSAPLAGSMMPNMSGHPMLEAFKKGVANSENASYFQPADDPKSSAFGKYQFNKPTLENVREKFFPNIKKNDFVTTYQKDPQFQETVMDKYSTYLLSKYPTPQNAALAFFLGEGGAKKVTGPSYRPTPTNSTVGQYLGQFNKGFSGQTFKEGGTYELTDVQISQLRKQGYELEIIK